MCRSYATLQRQSTSKDASGGIVSVYAAVSGYSSVSCDIQPASGTIRDQYMRQGTFASHTLYFPDDIPAVAGDRLQTTNDRTGVTHTYLFRGRRGPAQGYDQWACVVDVEEQIT
jgi:hypothetical protein